MSVRVILTELHNGAKVWTEILIILIIIRSYSSKEGKEGHSKQKKSHVHAQLATKYKLSQVQIISNISVKLESRKEGRDKGQCRSRGIICYMVAVLRHADLRSPLYS